MPAAAVIPAPLAYTKVVAVKKLVVGFLTFFMFPVVYLRSSLLRVEKAKRLVLANVCHPSAVCRDFFY